MNIIKNKTVKDIIPKKKLNGRKKIFIKISITPKPRFIQAWLIWFWFIWSIGDKKEVAAIISITLAILLPTTAPTAKSEWLDATALIDLASSGKDVPPATITIPIAKSETFNLLPKLTDPRIIISAPKIKIDKPTNKKIKFTIM